MVNSAGGTENDGIIASHISHAAELGPDHSNLNFSAFNVSDQDPTYGMRYVTRYYSVIF